MKLLYLSRRERQTLQVYADSLGLSFAVVRATYVQLGKTNRGRAWSTMTALERLYVYHQERRARGWVRNGWARLCVELRRAWRELVAVHRGWRV